MRQENNVVKRMYSSFLVNGILVLIIFQLSKFTESVPTQSTAVAFDEDFDFTVVALIGEQFVITCEVTGNPNDDPRFIVFSTNGDQEQVPADKCRIANDPESDDMQYRLFYYICVAAADDDGKRIGCTTTEEDLELIRDGSIDVKVVSKEDRSNIPDQPQAMTSSNDRLFTSPMTNTAKATTGLEAVGTTGTTGTAGTTRRMAPCTQTGMVEIEEPGTHRHRRDKPSSSPNDNPGINGSTTIIVSLSVTTAVLAMFLLMCLVYHLKQRRNIHARPDIELNYTMGHVTGNVYQTGEH